METKGGRVSIQIGSKTYTARAGVQIMGATIERTNGVNRDGTGFSTVAAKLAKCELTFDRGERLGIIFDDAMLLGEHNVTVSEEDTRITHFFTGAAISGTPTLDTESGEVSGLSFETDRGNYSFRTE